MTITSIVPTTPARGPSAAPVPESEQVRRLALAQQTSALFRELRTAGPEAARLIVDEVVTTHLWVADSVARRFRDRGEEADDLRQIARAGLVEACGRFEVEQGSFVAFAFPTVTGLVKRHFRDHGWSIRPPRSTQELSAELWRRWPEVAQTVAAEPSERQLAEALGTSLQDLRRARRASQAYSCSSLDARTHDRSSDEPDDERYEARMLVASVWSALSAEEQELLTMRFVEERTQSSIAELLGTNQMQVSRRLTRLLSRMRGLIGSLDGSETEAVRAA